MRALTLLLLLLPVCALAQSAGTPAQMAGVPSQSGALSCDAWYPAKEHAAGVDGNTILSVYVALDGSLRAAAVVKSSGNAALDAAALQCSKHVQMQPVRVEGAVAEVSWQIEVAWHRDAPSYFNPPLLAFDAGKCGYPTLAIRLNHEGIAIVTYDIARDGTVRNLDLARSSGHDELDNVAMSCAASRRYPPATAGGKDVQIDWYSRFIWHLSGG